MGDDAVNDHEALVRSLVTERFTRWNAASATTGREPADPTTRERPPSASVSGRVHHGTSHSNVKSERAR